MGDDDTINQLYSNVVINVVKICSCCHFYNVKVSIVTVVEFVDVTAVVSDAYDLGVVVFIVVKRSPPETGIYHI